MNALAPVLIPTLNRYDHFKRCVESLSKCDYAEETDLIIALDYPLTEEHWTGYKLICDYIEKINSFRKVILIKRESNYGVIKNIFGSIQEIFLVFDQIIFTEDDNIFATDFLSFINQGLELFKEREDIFSISGYGYPISVPKDYYNEIYMWQGFSAWGVGLWKNKWNHIDFEPKETMSNIRHFLKRYYQVYRFHAIANHYSAAMITILEKSKVSADGTICLYQYLNRMYSVFPSVSRVRNMGHDGSGTGCGFMEVDDFSRQEIYTGIKNYVLPKSIKTDLKINNILSIYFKRSLKSQLKTFAKVFLVNIGLWPRREN